MQTGVTVEISKFIACVSQICLIRILRPSVITAIAEIFWIFFVKYLLINLWTVYRTHILIPRQKWTIGTYCIRKKNDNAHKGELELTQL